MSIWFKIVLGSVIAGMVLFIWRYGRVALNIDVSLAKSMALSLEESRIRLKETEKENSDLRHKIEHLEIKMREYRMLKEMIQMGNALEKTNHRLNELLKD